MTDGPLASVMRPHGLDAERVEVPSGHAPRLRAYRGKGSGLTLHEPDAGGGAWLTAETTVDVYACR